MEELDQFLSLVRQRGHDVWLAGPASRDAVSTLESTFGVTLPPSLVAFLMSWGALSIYDNTVSGIIDDNPLDETCGSLYGDTLILRAESDLPGNLFVVGRHEDGAYCLDSTDSAANAEWPVINLTNGSSPTRVSVSFREWLQDFVLSGWTNEDA